MRHQSYAEYQRQAKEGNRKKSKDQRVAKANRKTYAGRTVVKRGILWQPVRVMRRKGFRPWLKSLWRRIQLEEGSR